MTNKGKTRKFSMRVRTRIIRVIGSCPCCGGHIRNGVCTNCGYTQN